MAILFEHYANNGMASKATSQTYRAGQAFRAPGCGFKGWHRGKSA